MEDAKLNVTNDGQNVVADGNAKSGELTDKELDKVAGGIIIIGGISYFPRFQP